LHCSKHAECNALNIFSDRILTILLNRAKSIITLGSVYIPGRKFLLINCPCLGYDLFCKVCV
jgi:hypothetical protein